VIFGSRIRGAKIRAEGAREEAAKAIRAADRAEHGVRRLVADKILECAARRQDLEWFNCSGICRSDPTQ
jgi:hypothetical protein